MTFLTRKSVNIIPLEKRVMLDASLPALTGQVLWLDANDTATILDAEGDNAASGAAFSGSVTTWVDKSTSGYNVTAPASTSQPSYTTAALNGNNVLTFDGAADLLRNTTAVISGDDYTTFIVFNRTTASGRDAVFEMGAGATRNGFFINDSNSGKISYYMNTLMYGFSSAYSVGSYTLISATQDNTSFTALQDGAAALSSTIAARTTTTGIFVGDDSTSGDQLLGNIAEIIVYDHDLTGDERHDVENYLASKWGLSIVNATPTSITNSTLAINEGATGSITNTVLSYTDTDNTDANLIYTITDVVDNGALRNTNTGLTLGLSDTFTQGDLNNGYITYTHNGSETTADSFSFTVTDQLATTSSATFSISVTPVNEAPVIDGWILVSSEDFESGATGWSDNTTTYGGTYYTTHLGRFSQDGGTQNVYKTYTLSGTQDSVSISFDFYEIDSWDTEQFIIFVDDVQIFNAAYTSSTFNAPVDGSSGAVSWTIQETSQVLGNIGYSSTYNDQRSHFILSIASTASSIKLGFSSTLNQVVTDEAWGVDNINVYEVSSGGTPGPFEIAENSANGTVVKTITATDPDVSDTLTYSLSGGTGLGVFTINASTGAITVTNSTALDYESTTSYTLDVTVTDSGGLTDTETITINVLDVIENTAPVISALGPLSLNESATVGTLVGTVVATDAESNVITYSITSGNADGIFAINSSTGAITVASTLKLNYERATTYTLTVRAIDNGFGTLSSTRNIVINIADINEAPSFAAVQRILDSDVNLYYNATSGNFYKYVSSIANLATATANANATLLFGVGGYLATPTSASENALLASLISTSTWIGGSDATTEGQWEWVDGLDAGFFWSGGSGGSAQNGYYTNWQSGEPNNSGSNEDGIQIYVGGKWNDIAVTANLPYLVEWDGVTVAAAITQNGPYTLTENSLLNTSVGYVAAADPDTGDVLTYSITGGTGAAHFAVNASTGEITLTNPAAANYELATSYTLDMRVQDVAGLFDTVTVTINIADANDMPTAIGLSNNRGMENSAIGTVVGLLSTTDEDVADTHTYTLLSNPGNKFSIVGNEIRVAANIDYEQVRNIPISVRTDDGNGGTFDQNFTIQIGNEADTFSPAPDGGIPTSGGGTHSDGGVSGLRDAQESLVQSSLFQGEQGQLSAFYGLGKFAQILRENTTFDLRRGFENLKSRIMDAMDKQSGLMPDEIAANDLQFDIETSAHYTRLQQALNFISQIEQPDGVDFGDGKSPDADKTAESADVFNPLNQQFVDIMTYHEQRQAHLRKALLDG